jgi:hypothetical protein
MTQQEHDPLDTTAQERTDAKRAEEERQQREKEQNDLRYVMGSKQGRRFVYRQLSEAGVWRSSFDTDNAVMAFNEGNRNRGLSLLTEILEACADRYTEMLAEHKEAKDKHDNRHADRRNRTRTR